PEPRPSPHPGLQVSSSGLIDRLTSLFGRGNKLHDPIQVDLVDRRVHDAIFRDDPELGDTRQRHAVLRMPLPQAAGVDQNDGAVIFADRAQNPGMNARTSAAGNHVSAKKGMNQILHVLSPTRVSRENAGAYPHVQAWDRAYPARSGGGHSVNP